ncbi:MAG: HD domain-containing protein [Spirochaetaceae bacterium]|nr:MAG: HD domain-containing protein [Spirochaetaceae bacterium]
MNLTERLADRGIRHFFAGSSALDHYFKLKHGRTVYLDVVGSLIDIAKISDELEYPGVEHIDAVITEAGSTICIRCLDREPDRKDTFLPHLSFRLDPQTRSYLDLGNAYGMIRRKAVDLTDVAPFLTDTRGRQPTREGHARRTRIVLEAALLAGRYGFEISQPELLPHIDAAEGLSVFEQRTLLMQIATGLRPDLGFGVLMDSGFVAAYWPVLLPMNETEHSKENHPEGNVWEHVLESFVHRKSRDAVITLALLLHDCGKPYSNSEDGNRFHKHAEIGAHYARRFLRELRFPDTVVEDVAWLIRWHMIPGALPQLPVFRTRALMRSKLFPALLEVYRCDLSSTWRGPDGYYRACKVYRRFLRNESNPFRDSEGKKLLQLYVD